MPVGWAYVRSTGVFFLSLSCIASVFLFHCLIYYLNKVNLVYDFHLLLTRSKTKPVKLNFFITLVCEPYYIFVTN